MIIYLNLKGETKTNGNVHVSHFKEKSLQYKDPMSSWQLYS